MQPNIEPPDQLALRLWTTVRKRDWDLVRTLIHRDAELQTGVAGNELLNAELAVTATEIAVAADAYDPKLRSFEALDEHTALVAGQTHHRHPDERIEERQMVWLFTFESSLLIRSRLFDSIQEALDHHHKEVEARKH